MAAFRTANPTGKITLHPVDAEVGVLLLYASFVVLTACTQAALFWVEETHVLHGASPTIDSWVENMFLES